jgi:hypothetical protein
MYGGWCGEVLDIATRYGVRYWQLTVFSLSSATLAFVCVYAWYLSLTRTTVAANNSIYQVYATTNGGVAVVRCDLTLPFRLAVVFRCCVRVFHLHPS